MKHKESSWLWAQSKQLGPAPLWLLSLVPGRLVQTRWISEMEMLPWGCHVPGRGFIISLLFAVFWESLWYYSPNCHFLFAPWPQFPMKHAAGWALKSLLVMLSWKISLWFSIHWTTKVRKESCAWLSGEGAGKMGRHQGILGPPSCPGGARMTAILVPSLLTRYKTPAYRSWTASRAMSSHGPCPWMGFKL